MIFPFCILWHSHYTLGCRYVIIFTINYKSKKPIKVMTHEKPIFSLIKGLRNTNYQSESNFHCGHKNIILGPI